MNQIFVYHSPTDAAPQFLQKLIPLTNQNSGDRPCDVFKLVYLHVTQPCLHTLMQARLSANQSERTILVIL